MGAGLAIYLVAADTESADQLKAMLNESKLDGTPWPIPVTIDVVDVSAFNREFLVMHPGNPAPPHSRMQHVSTLKRLRCVQWWVCPRGYLALLGTNINFTFQQQPPPIPETQHYANSPPPQNTLVRMRHGPLSKFPMRHKVGAFWRLMLPWLLYVRPPPPLPPRF